MTENKTIPQDIPAGTPDGALIQHFTAWMTNDSSCLEGDFCDVAVLEDYLIGEDPETDGNWASGGNALFHALTATRHDGSVDQAVAEARDALESNGWRLVGEWTATDTSYVVTVERA